MTGGIEPVEAALASCSTKKLIIVPMLGTHRGLSSKVPRILLHTFKDTVGAAQKWITPEMLAEYNSYDDACVLHDDVVAPPD